MGKLTSVCVYCGSGEGRNRSYAQAAQTLGEALAGNDLRLVYGGGSVGLMGIVARAVLDQGGEVTGIIPEFLQNRERMLNRVHDLRVVEDMHTRKRMMFEEADAFVALPGGVGTLEELIEMMTWSQLGQHSKPVLLANIDGFWNPLLSLLDHMEREAFLRPGMMVHYTVVDRAEDIIPRLRTAAEVTIAPAPDAPSLDRF